MKANDNKDLILKALLADVYKETTPEDSWKALRTRIDYKLKDYECRFGQAKMDKSVIFWRRIAFATVACLAITFGLLVYTLISKGTAEDSRSKNEGLLSQSQLNQLSTTFSHVRQLFGSHSPWMVVSTTGDSEIGVDNKMAESMDDGKVIVMRLIVSLEEQNIKRQYFDIVTFANQEAQFRVPLGGPIAIDITTKPVLNNDDTIVVEIKAQVDNRIRASGAGTVANNALTSLVSMRINENLVNIDATAHLLSNI